MSGSQALRPLAGLVLAITLLGFPAQSSASRGRVYLSGFPALRQQHSLTCEASATSMATRAHVRESQIMSFLPRNPNPNLGFRGNPDGTQGTRLVDYGVYAGPVQKVLLHYGYKSDSLMYGDFPQIISYINRGWPVVAWVTYALQRARPRFAWWSGSQFFLVPHEHTVLITGYDSSSVVVNDPWDGGVYRYKWQSFNRAWGYFGRMALAVNPCAVPKQVTRLRSKGVTTIGMNLSWKKVPADHYQITIIRSVSGQPDTTTYKGTVPTNTFTRPSPLANANYQVTVRAVASCGSTSKATTLWIQTPAVLPTPMPSPTASPLPTHTPTTR